MTLRKNPTWKGNEKSILIMDDEPLIVDLAGEIVKTMGYEAAFAKHGDEAIQMYKRAMSERRPYDAVILDLNVKRGLGGRDPLEIITSLDPNVRAIVSTGFAKDPVMADYRSHGFKAALEKPYTKADLIAVLTSVLEHE